ncbi:penicillin-binding transpeptidase domain-containing protein [Aneurinibacillus sp. Ricciae_BoGa-3]|uniref:PASTA domain-containing penicillin-binding protein n=1 Tax=Aneurinibacillus sp. Ricciae_BoGa-3 TaxID=3022697 RepID=UPI0023422333|nr:PASTA domain-containing penicillin-binding protein [Aneurinibacillus sp. Ricciae_BoGa-3]WCK53090.1 penicillin-binding transpeptidase domain-containing protein [Aneurinibacillus sp. Ricciae_BoGa-3]
MVKKRIAYRTLGLGAIFTALFFLLILRSYWVQAVDRSNLMAKARVTWERSDAINPKRGEILDRNGQILAYTSKAYTVTAQLKPLSNDNLNSSDYVKDPQMTVEKLAPILGVTPDSLLPKLTNKNSRQIELRPAGWKISKDIADKITALKLPGVGVYPDTKRYYPFGALASQVVGFTNLDGQAQMGVEYSEDKALKGQKGSFTFKMDSRGNQLPDGVQSYKPAIDGSNVSLTIDRQIQTYVEDALDDAMAHYKVKGLTCIVTNPNTGEVLAMGNRPAFNPNTYWNSQNGFANDAVSSNFEPGSTFKIVTLSAAIEEGVFNQNDTYMSGLYRFKNPNIQPIQDHNGGVGWGRITFKEGVKRSSNVAFVMLGYDHLGKDKLFSYIQKFGFGQQTGIELPGEARGILNFEKAYPRDVAAMAFGQGVGVTAIQQVAAVGAVANGGNLMQPYLVKELDDPKTNKPVSVKQPKVIRRVISENTSKQVRDLLGAVVNEKNGTGQLEAIPGYDVAGKTGTAQFIGSNGQYVPGRYINSFIGFAPKKSPKLLVYVVVDNAEIGEAAGAQIVAPIFKYVMQHSLQYLKLAPDNSVSNKTVTVKTDQVTMPQTVGEQSAKITKQLAALGLHAQTLGSGGTVLGQYPKEDEVLSKGTDVYLLTAKKDLKMPDLTGKTLRDVMEICALLQIKVSGIQGEGFVTAQSLPVGITIKKGDTLNVEMAPKSEIPPPASQNPAG